MPQITTWLIVSEQMSRLSEIWARLVREPPPSSAFTIVTENLSIKPRASDAASQMKTTTTTKKQKFKNE